jgi:hypothetical protein
VLNFALQSRKKRDDDKIKGVGAGPQPGGQDPMAIPGEELPPPDVNVPGMPPPPPGGVPLDPMLPPPEAPLPPGVV